MSKPHHLRMCAPPLYFYCFTRTLRLNGGYIVIILYDYYHHYYKNLLESRRNNNKTIRKKKTFPYYKTWRRRRWWAKKNFQCKRVRTRYDMRTHTRVHSSVPWGTCEEKASATTSSWNGKEKKPVPTAFPDGFVRYCLRAHGLSSTSLYMPHVHNIPLQGPPFMSTIAARRKSNVVSLALSMFRLSPELRSPAFISYCACII